ncbi:hypothetical protein T439DRAFT_292598 [Meredithblackwellia eburnea MCA 4105]
MPPKPKKSHGQSQARWTTKLPHSLRQELEQLGHLDANKNKKKGSIIGRRERRKEERKNKGKQQQSSSTNKPEASQQQGKRQREEGSTSGQYEKEDGKRRKVDQEAQPTPGPSSQQKEQPQKKKTALQKLVEKQEQRTSSSVSRKTPRSQEESTEDKEIAWLEAMLRGSKRDEFTEDGLDELFDGMDDLEHAAFGSDDEKDYARLLPTSNHDDDDEFDEEGDFDEEGLESGEEQSYLNEGGEEEELPSSDEEEYGIDDDELVNPSDDDDHAELGEIGREELSGSEEEFADGSDGKDDEEEEEEWGGIADDEDEKSAGKRNVRFNLEPQPPSGSAFKSEGVPPVAEGRSADLPAPAAGRYVPPHLRGAPSASSTTSSTSSPTSATTAIPEQPANESTQSFSQTPPPIDPRLKRQIISHVNKLTSSNISAILSALTSLYSSNPRAIVSHALTTVLLDNLASSDRLGEGFLTVSAALVGAISRAGVVGNEWAAGVTADSVDRLEKARDETNAPLGQAKSATGDQGASNAADDQDFEGRPASKTALNLVAFLAELYNFQVVGCGLVYDLVRLFIGEGGTAWGELDVELLVGIVKRCGQQLRQDDPSALKEIVNLVKQKTQALTVSGGSMSLRAQFMVEQLSNLKNNKIRPTGDGKPGTDANGGLKKFLSGLKKGGSAPDPLRLSLSDLHTASTKGKWWIVGAAWGGNPLIDGGATENLTVGASASELRENGEGQKMAQLAKKQGMNTDVRKGVFTVLMSSEDYVDACERLLQLGLTDVQQREIAREKVYNPYYTLVAHRLASKSHSFQITLQYCLWDFLRELGEKKVGGEELVKSMGDEEGGGGRYEGKKVSSRRLGNLAKLFAWCVAKDVLGLAILKPIPFESRLKPKTITFLTQFFNSLIISTQTPSPALVLPTTTGTRKDREALERVFVRVAPHQGLVKGLMTFFDEKMGEESIDRSRSEREKQLVKWGSKVATETLGMGGSIVDVR